MFMAEGMHPSAQRAADARLLAAIYNGPMRPRGSGEQWSGWKGADFMADSFWTAPPATPVAVTPASIAAQVALLNARLER